MKKLKSWQKCVLKWSLILGVLAAVLHWGIGLYACRGNAMYPAMKDGDLVIFDRLARPQPGDAVVYTTAEGKRRLSRIAAIEGETVSFTEAGWLLDGRFPNEEIFYETRPDPESEIAFPHTVQGFFLLDDYRPGSGDSRIQGDVPAGRILGKAVFVLRIRGL